MTYMIYSRASKEDISSHLRNIDTSKYSLVQKEVSDYVGNRYHICTIKISSNRALRELKASIKHPMRMHSGFIDSHYMDRDGQCLEIIDTKSS